MIRPSRQKRDEILEELHNQYLDDIRSSGLPLYLALDIYGYTPLSVSFKQRTHRRRGKRKLPRRY